MGSLRLHRSRRCPGRRAGATTWAGTADGGRRTAALQTADGGRQTAGWMADDGRQRARCQREVVERVARDAPAPGAERVPCAESPLAAYAVFVSSSLRRRRNRRL